MKRGFWIALVSTSCLTVGLSLSAQAPAGAGAAQGKPASESQKPVSAQPRTSSNPFPEDITSVPLMPSKITPDLPPGTFGASEREVDTLPGDDLDPVRSPDEPAAAGERAQEQDSSSSSSLSGLDSLLPGPGDDDTGKRKRRGAQAAPKHVETATEDISVGKYYLSIKNWRAALSRFQSALVLAPEDPEVYWGLAESAHRMGNFADARSYYLKVIEYDPDSRHAKDAAKALKEPDLINAKAAPPLQ